MQNIGGKGDCYQLLAFLAWNKKSNESKGADIKSWASIIAET